MGGREAREFMKKMQKNIQIETLDIFLLTKDLIYDLPIIKLQLQTTNLRDRKTYVKLGTQTKIK